MPVFLSTLNRIKPARIRINPARLSFGFSQKIYPETNGDVSGIIGRYSGQLVVNFDRYDNDKRQSLVFNCKKFEPIEKKF